MKLLGFSIFIILGLALFGIGFIPGFIFVLLGIWLFTNNSNTDNKEERKNR
jgi:hypothetical protein